MFLLLALLLCLAQAKQLPSWEDTEPGGSGYGGENNEETTGEKYGELFGETVGELDGENNEEIAEENIGEMSSETMRELDKENFEETTGENYEEMYGEYNGELNRENKEETNGEYYEQIYGETIGELNRENKEETTGENIGEMYEETIGELNSENNKETTEENNGEMFEKMFRKFDREINGDNVKTTTKEGIPSPVGFNGSSAFQCVDEGCGRQYGGNGICVDFSSQVDFQNLAKQFELTAGSVAGVCGPNKAGREDCCHCLKFSPPTITNPMVCTTITTVKCPFTSTTTTTTTSTTTTTTTSTTNTRTTSTTATTTTSTTTTTTTSTTTTMTTSTTTTSTTTSTTTTTTTSTTYKTIAKTTTTPPSTTTPSISTATKAITSTATAFETTSPQKCSRGPRVIALGGDTDSGVTDSVEELEMMGNIKNLPRRRWRHSAFVLPDSQDILVCGGKGRYDGTETLKACIVHTNNTWTDHSSLLHPRIYSSTVVMPSGDLYLIGGSYSAETSEVLQKGASTWTEGPALTAPLDRACAVNLDRDRFALIGGGVNHDMVSVFNLATGGWNNTWSRLGEAHRRTGHSCVRIQDQILVAGGYSYTTWSYTGSTLLIDTVTGLVSRGRDMVVARSYFTMQSVSGMALAIGGVTRQGYTHIVEQWDPAREDWSVNSNISLVNGRSAYASVVLTCPTTTAETTPTIDAVNNPTSSTISVSTTTNTITTTTTTTTATTITTTTTTITNTVKPTSTASATTTTATAITTTTTTHTTTPTPTTTLNPTTTTQEIPATITTAQASSTFSGQCVEDNPQRLLQKFISVTENSPSRCIKACKNAGYQLAGVQSTSQCFCGNTPPPWSVIRPDNECNHVCPGNRNQKCGGTWRMNVYTTAPWVGECVEDNPKRLLQKQISVTNNSPSTCIKACKNAGYQLAGVQYTSECFCGNTPPPWSVIRPDNECNNVCPGNRNQKCGGTWRMNIYTTTT